MKSLFKVSSLLFLLFSFHAWSSLDISEQLGVRSRGMGGAGRAVATTNETLHLNPAGMSQYSRFDFDLDYVFRLNNPFHFIGLTLVDSTTTPFAGGIDFHMGIDSEASSEALSYLGSMALSLPIINEVFFIGASGKYAYLPSTLAEPTTVARFGLDAGVLIRLPNGLSLSATGYNLIPTDSKRLPLSVGFGAGLNLGGDVASAIGDLSSVYRGMTIAFDWLMRDLTSGTEVDNCLMVGIETLLFDAMPVRAGYSYSLLPKEHEISFGLGYLKDNIGLEGFFEQNLTLSSSRSFGFALRMFF